MDKPTKGPATENLNERQTTTDRTPQTTIDGTAERIAISGPGPSETGSESFTETDADPFDTSHFDELHIDGEPLGGGAGGDGGAAFGGPAIMAREEFRAAFVAVFNIAGGVSGLQSIAIDAGEKPKAEACADAIYDTALEVPWLRFLIEPSNIWLQRALVVGMFTIPKALAVRNELAARRRPANDNTEPGGPVRNETGKPNPFDWAGENPRNEPERAA